jgi:protein-L-isoaspartate O-methyltransferase
MKRILVLMALLLAVGCGDIATRHVIVVPVDEQDLLDGKALLLVNANAAGGQVKTPEDADDDKKPVKCLCGGTGRSGDGLGPCACPDGCTCKTTRSEVDADQEIEQPVDEPSAKESEAKTEEAVPVPKDAPEPATATESPEFVEDEAGEALDRVVGVVETLTDSQVKMAERMLDFEKRLKSLEQPVAKAAEPEKPKVSGFTESQARAAKLVFVTQASCQPCVRVIEEVFPELERRGWMIAKDGSGWTAEDGSEAQIQIVEFGGLQSTSEAAEAVKWAKRTPFYAYFLNGKLVTTATGFWDADSIERKLNEISGITKPQASTSPKKVDVYKHQTQSRLPVVKTPWGPIDLETYQRNCNCNMCQGIRALQAQFRQSSMVSTMQAVAAVQEPSTDEIIEQVITALGLQAGDTFADIGCGDGRVLIAAVNASGCKAVGIELDPEKAKLARHRVAEAGLSDKITILTGDARRFDPSKYNVTAGVAYLYPQLLGELRPMLSRIGRLATPFHQVPGMEMTRTGELWLKTEKSVDGLQEI